LTSLSYLTSPLEDIENLLNQFKKPRIYKIEVSNSFLRFIFKLGYSFIYINFETLIMEVKET